MIKLDLIIKHITINKGEKELMKKNSLKRKIIAGTVAAGLISSAGFAFANTDAGEALKNWYDGKFNQAVAESEEEVQEYGESLLPGLNEELEGLKDEATASIYNTRDSETESSLSEIERAKQAHLESLIDEHGEILGYMEQQFFEVYMDNWLEIQALAAEGAEYAGAELETLTGEKGEESLQHVTDELTTAKDGAVQELEDEIERAKEELTTELDNHSGILTDNLTKEIDFSVDTLRDTVSQLKEDLVQEQQEIITAEAAKLEKEAKDSLDEVVSGIDE